MEDEKILSAYDPRIIGRILKYVRPYLKWAVLAVLGMILATAAELLLPVIMQRVIDNYIVVKYTRLQPGTDYKAAGVKAIVIAGIPFARNLGRETLPKGSTAHQAGAPGRESTELSSFYLFSITNSPAQAKLLKAKPGLFLTDGVHGAISDTKLAALNPSQKLALRGGDVRGILWWSVISLGLLGMSLIFSFIQVYFMAQTGQAVMKDLRMNLFSHILFRSLEFFNVSASGSLVSRLTNDVETINDFFTDVATALLKDTALMIGVLITLFFMDAKLAGVTLATLPLVAGLTIFFRKNARDAYRNVRRWVSKVNSFLAEHIAGIHLVQIFVQEKRSQQQFREENSRLLKADLKEMYVFGLFRPMVNMLSSLSIGVVIYFGAGLNLQGAVSLGVLIAFISLIGKFYQPTRDIAEKLTQFQSAMAGGERVFQLLDNQESVADQGGYEPVHTEGEIRFQNVFFAYKQEEPLLKDLSFSIRPGETVALVGYTGAGKTTMANLITRFWDTDKGEIFLDQRNIRDYSLAALRRLIQPVQQEVFLFSGTIEDNIKLGSAISREQVETACQVVHAHGFISRLENGYDSEVAEGGVNLSSGERQLIAFARIIAHDPPVLILDEATANIDTETEKLIQKALGEVTRGRTSLVIAHRLSTITHADRILVINQGALVEQGRHQELMERKGDYYNLYKLQGGGDRF